MINLILALEAAIPAGLASILVIARCLFFYVILLFLSCLLLSSCVAPVYENTLFDIDEFKQDSQQIAQGKLAILALEEQEGICSLDPCDLNNDIVIDGDELSITLHCPRRPDRVSVLETLTQRIGFRICDGWICLPHLPPLEVAGLTLCEVSDRIQTAYSDELPGIRVFVNFKKRRERFVQVIGAGQSMIAVDGHIRLSEVLAKVDLYPYANLFKSYVMRNGQRLGIDLYKLVHQGEENQNIVMRGGDQIFIANTFDASIMVTGEVGNPIVIPVPYGYLSLREALGIAGGIPFTGNKSSIQVIRGALIRPKIYSLNWKDITHVPNESLLLMAGDVVVISEKPITRWNRFIDQLQPSTGCMQTGCNICEIMRS